MASALVVAALGFASGSAWAQSNDRLAPVGGRSTLLGGTGMAYGRDAAAAFLNPATAVLVDDQRLSFSVNVYRISFAYAPRWYTPGAVDRSKFGDVKSGDVKATTLDFDALPSSLCFFLRAGEVNALKLDKDPRTREARLGLCFATVQSESFNYTDEGFTSGRTRQAQTLASSFTRFAAGPTYAMHVTRALALGASVHATLTNYRSVFSATATTYGGALPPIDSLFYSGSRGHSYDIDGLVGATLRWGKQTVGVSLQSPSLHIYGAGGASEQTSYGGGGSAATSITAATGNFASRTPMRIGIGSGLEANWGQAEFDVFYTMPIGTPYRAELQGTRLRTANGIVDDRTIDVALGERARSVVNFAVGAELFVSERISMLCGLSTDSSTIPRGALRGSLFNYALADTHRVAGSLGFGSHGSGGELLVGGELSYGWGERLAVSSYQLPPVITPTSQQTYQLLFVIAGSTSVRALKRAAKDIQEVVNVPDGRQHLPGAPRESPAR